MSQEPQNDIDKDTSEVGIEVVAVWLFLIVLIFIIGSKVSNLSLPLTISQIPFTSLWLLLIFIWIVPAIGETFHHEKIRYRLKNFKTHMVRTIGSVLIISTCAVSFLVAVRNEVQQERQQERQEAIVEAYPVPVITILSSQEDQGDAMSYLLEFTTKDATDVCINGGDNLLVSDDTFSIKIPLTSTSTSINIKAENEYKSAEADLNITRNKTAEDIAIEEAEAKEALSVYVSDQMMPVLKDMKDCNDSVMAAILSSSWVSTDTTLIYLLFNQAEDYFVSAQDKMDKLYDTPQEMEEFNTKLSQSIDLYVESVRLFQDAISDNDISKIDDGYDKYYEAIVVMNEAKEMLKNLASNSNIDISGYGISF